MFTKAQKIAETIVAVVVFVPIFAMALVAGKAAKVVRLGYEVARSGFLTSYTGKAVYARNL